MANPKHLAKLMEGVEPWGEWRSQNQDIRPDLRNADLGRVYLKEANLSCADLRCANLSFAKLNRANLNEANLDEAHLEDAELISANLHRATLRHAKLAGALLDGAHLNGAELFSANLERVSLKRAKLTEANMHEADLTQAILRDADLSRADLADADLPGADLIGAELVGSRLNGANLCDANLSGAQLRGADASAADLSMADLSAANLSGAQFRGAKLCGANLALSRLVHTDFSGADLQGARLDGATLLVTNLAHANLTGCSVYGISAWDVALEGANQSSLVITNSGSPIQVDNLEVAQFIYLLLNNQKIRNVIDTITSKVVLILGRFSPDRKAVLDAIREELRRRDYLPVLFDFEKPSSQTTVETISTLAHMARFVIADLTDAKSVLQELQAVVPQSPSVVVQPLLLASQEEPGMFDFIRGFPWVLDTHRYTDQTELLLELKEEVIDPAEVKSRELAQKR